MAEHAVTYGIVRLTLFGLISALENDLRQIIRDQIAQNDDLEGIVPAETWSKIRERANGSDRGEYIYYLDFGDEIQIINSRLQQLSSDVQKVVKRHKQLFERMIPIRNRVMHSRPLNFDDYSFVVASCEQLVKISSKIFSSIFEFSKNVAADPSFVLSLDVTPLEDYAREENNFLPIPDFDETGFLGRANETEALFKVCRGSWPVVTVVGEGGVGKTALALKVAYDLVDTQEFEAAVWVSSKTTRLTQSDIENIDGAIHTSLGILEHLKSKLDGNQQDDALDSVLFYLNHFKVLLVIDNLETVLDARIRDFLSQLSGASKVLITSKVSIGELDYRFPLSGMSSEDAVQLLRATAKVRRVPELTQTKGEILRTYCRRMKNNPLFIKWFVSAVQSGKRPEEVLVAPTIFLDFCLSNVYGYLSEDAREIAHAMLAVPGKHAQPVLSYLTDIEGHDFQVALQQLITTNIAVMSSTPTEHGYESVYELGELPRLYLLKNHGLRRDKVQKFQARKNEIIQTYEMLNLAESDDKYRPNTISIRTRDDAVVAKYLIQALTLTRLRKYEDALSVLEKAKLLAPGFFEVYRVEGWVLAFAGNFPASLAAYETAVELEPNSAPLRYWYGGFLLRNANNIDGALEQLDAAHALDPNAISVTIERGRALMFLGKFEEAEKSILEVIENNDVTLKYQRIAYDSWCQISQRRALKSFEKGDFEEALLELERLAQKFLSVPPSCWDDKLLITAARAVPQYRRLEAELSRSDLMARAADARAQLEAIAYRTPSSRSEELHMSSPPKIENEVTIEAGVRERGVVAKMDPVRRFGFLKSDRGQSVFFHFSYISTSKFVPVIRAGDRVSYVVKSDGERLGARSIEVLARDSEKPDGSLSRYTGVVKALRLDKGFGFLRTQHHGELFFHKTGFSGGLTMADLSLGDEVEYHLGKNPKGIAAMDITKSASNLLERFARAGEVVSGRFVPDYQGKGPHGVIPGIGAVAILPEHFLDQNDWEVLRDDDWVQFVVSKSESDYYADSISRLTGQKDLETRGNV